MTDKEEEIKKRNLERAKRLKEMLTYGDFGLSEDTPSDEEEVDMPFEEDKVPEDMPSPDEEPETTPSDIEDTDTETPPPPFDTTSEDLDEEDIDFPPPPPESGEPPPSEEEGDILSDLDELDLGDLEPTIWEDVSEEVAEEPEIPAEEPEPPMPEEEPVMEEPVTPITEEEPLEETPVAEEPAIEKEEPEPVEEVREDLIQIMIEVHSNTVKLGRKNITLKESINLFELIIERYKDLEDNK
jgi:hypothetical protein